MWFWSNICKERRGECDQWLDVVLIKHIFFTYVWSEPHLIIGHIPPSFLYICLIRTTSNHWSHMWPMIRCGSDQTHVKKGGRNVTNDYMWFWSNICKERREECDQWLDVSEPHLIIGHIPPSFLYICFIRTTSNHWSHSSLLSLHVFDQNHI
jgi:hypothetical protein